jgi:RimJ/RimL family protein N-acetyltransferase
MLRPDYPLTTERLTIRPFAAGDMDDVLAFRGLPEVARYVPFSVQDRDGVATFLADSAARTALSEEGDFLVLAVVQKDTVIGEVLLFWRNREQRQGEVGYAFNPAFGGHGYATEAAREMLRLGFDALGLNRIIGRIDARNDASARVLERLGMRKEAHFVENEVVKGEMTSEIVYAMLHREWKAQTAP